MRVNSIHATAILSGDVRLGTGNTIGPNVVIIGPVQIGDDNWIGTGVVIGAPPEVRSWPHPRDAIVPSSGNGIRIGSGNIIREYAQIHQGWKAQTIVGDGSFVMNQVYVAHDCSIADNATLASGVSLAGHVRIGRGANLGMRVTVHQRRIVSDGAMVGMSSAVTRDVPPFATVYGVPARIAGSNRVAMERAGLSVADREAMTAVYGEPHLDERALRELEARPDLARVVREWFARDTR